VERGPLRRAASLLAAALAGSSLALMGATTLVTPAAAAPPRATAAACTTHVEFGLIQAITSGCLDQVTPGRWETTDGVSLNGVPLTPAPGTKFVLVAPTSSAPGGQLSVTASIMPPE
jgi:hypothetical protein